jgi:hypothetical protein
VDSGSAFLVQQPPAHHHDRPTTKPIEKVRITERHCSQQVSVVPTPPVTIPKSLATSTQPYPTNHHALLVSAAFGGTSPVLSRAWTVSRTRATTPSAAGPLNPNPATTPTSVARAAVVRILAMLSPHCQLSFINKERRRRRTLG